MFVGSESFLLANMRNGGAGCISATANVNPAAIDKLYREWKNADADAQQAALDAVRDDGRPVRDDPGAEGGIAHYAKDPDWVTVRPPLVELTRDEQASLAAELKAIDFQMPGLHESRK